MLVLQTLSTVKLLQVGLPTSQITWESWPSIWFSFTLTSVKSWGGILKSAGWEDYPVLHYIQIKQRDLCYSSHAWSIVCLSILIDCYFLPTGSWPVNSRRLIVFLPLSLWQEGKPMTTHLKCKLMFWRSCSTNMPSSKCDWSLYQASKISFFFSFLPQWCMILTGQVGWSSLNDTRDLAGKGFLWKETTANQESGVVGQLACSWSSHLCTQPQL